MSTLSYSKQDRDFVAKFCFSLRFGVFIARYDFFECLDLIFLTFDLEVLHLLLRSVSESPGLSLMERRTLFHSFLSTAIAFLPGVETFSTVKVFLKRLIILKTVDVPIPKNLAIIEDDHEGFS